MVATISANEKPLGDVFCDKYLFNIPPYQRPYSWTTEEAGELLDDLTEAMGSAGDVRELPPYFLGSIVLIKEHEKPEADVVDGQQRLTTLTILFSTLRDLELEARSRDDIDEFITQRGNRAKGLDDRYRLTVRDRDADFFRRQIQESDPPEIRHSELSDSQRNIIANREYFQNEIRNFSRARRERLTQFATQRCYLVVVEASDRTSAYRIFSVMNNR